MRWQSKTHFTFLLIKDILAICSDTRFWFVSRNVHNVTRLETTLIQGSYACMSLESNDWCILLKVLLPMIIFSFSHTKRSSNIFLFMYHFEVREKCSLSGTCQKTEMSAFGFDTYFQIITQGIFQSLGFRTYVLVECCHCMHLPCYFLSDCQLWIHIYVLLSRWSSWNMFERKSRNSSSNLRSSISGVPQGSVL